MRHGTRETPGPERVLLFDKHADEQTTIIDVIAERNQLLVARSF